MIAIDGIQLNCIHLGRRVYFELNSERVHGTIEEIRHNGAGIRLDSGEGKFVKLQDLHFEETDLFSSRTSP